VRIVIAETVASGVAIVNGRVRRDRVAIVNDHAALIALRSSTRA